MEQGSDLREYDLPISSRREACLSSIYLRPCRLWTYRRDSFPIESLQHDVLCQTALIAIALFLSFLNLSGAQSGSCSATSDCISDYCNGEFYGFSPTYCGIGNCTSGCDAVAECGRKFASRGLTLQADTAQPMHLLTAMTIRLTYAAVNTAFVVQHQTSVVQDVSRMHYCWWTVSNVYLLLLL